MPHQVLKSNWNVNLTKAKQGSDAGAVNYDFVVTVTFLALILDLKQSCINSSKKQNFPTKDEMPLIVVVTWAE